MVEDKQTVEELEIVIKAKIEDAMKGIQSVTNEVKRQASQIKAPIQKASNEIDNQINKSAGTTGKSYVKQIAFAKEKLEDLYGQLDIAKNGDKQDKTFVPEIEADIEKQENYLSDLEKKQEKLNKEQKQGTEETKKYSRAHSELGRTLKKSLLTLFGVTSVWQLIRKGMSDATQSSEKLQAQQRVTSNAFGQAFLPIMEKVVAITQKAVIFIGLCVEALTGMNILARTTTQSIKDQNKALQGTLSSIDEIENLSQPNETYLNDVQALADFQEKVAEMRKWFENSKLKKLLEDIGDWWRKNWEPKIKPALDWLIEHPGIVIGAIGGLKLGGLALDILNLTSKVSGLGSALSGLLGFSGAVITLAIAYKIGSELYDITWGETYQKLQEYGKTMWESIQKGVDEAISGGDYAGAKDTIGNELSSLKYNLSSARNDWWNQLTKPTYLREKMNEIHKRYEEAVEQIKKLNEKGELGDLEVKEYIQFLEDYKKQLELVKGSANPVGETYKTAEKYIKDVNTQISNLKNGTKGVKDETEKMSKIFSVNYDELKKEIGDSTKKDSLIGKLKSVKDTLSDLVSNKYNVHVNFNAKTLTNSFNSWVEDLTKSKNSLVSTIGSVLKKSIIKEADGYVAYGPTFALQGEYANARTNPEITAPQSMIENTMLNAFAKILPYMNQGGNQGDTILYINGKEFARATYEDTQNEIKRRNGSTQIKVVK